MNPIRPESQAYALKRWMRADSHLFVHQDWRRYVDEGSEADSLFELYERKYRADQARIPAGNRDGGRWTDDEGQGDSSENPTRVAQGSSGIITDAFGEPYYRPGGHHEAPKGVYEKWKLNPETLKVFKESTTGKAPVWLRMTPGGSPIGNFWGDAHQDYNAAFKDLSDKYFEKNKIKPEQMTPDHARDILREVRESKDPRIKNFNNAIRFIGRLYRLRTGRE